MNARRRPAAPAAARLCQLERRLRRETRGEVLFDPAARGRYATDASIYQIIPVGVFVPRDEHDVAAAIDIARDLRVPVLRTRRRHQPVRTDGRRGAHHRLQQAPAAHSRGGSRRRRRRSRAGPRSRCAQCRLEPTRVVVSRRRLDRRASHTRRNGGQQFVRLALDRLRQHGAQRARSRRVVVGRCAGGARAGASARGPRRKDRRLRARPRGEPRPSHRRSLAQGAAPRGRLQPRHFRQPERAALQRGRRGQPRAFVRGLRRHAGAYPHIAAQARSQAARIECSASSTSPRFEPQCWPRSTSRGSARAPSS